MTGDRCVVCGAGTHRPADACARCKRILDRAETRRDASGGVRRVDAAARLRALARSWRDGAFHCFYTGVCLVEDHSRWRDHRYLVFEDRIPGDGASVVVTCALVSVVLKRPCIHTVGAIPSAKGSEMTAAQLITATSVAAVMISAFAIVAGLKGVRDQLRVTVFLTYTDRYARIMDGIPFEARQPGSGYRLAHQPRDEQTRVLSAFREYFNLSSEEKWLHEHRKIDRATWNMWVRSMQVVAQFPCFVEAWEALSFEYNFYVEFQNFVADTLLPHAVVSGQEMHAEAAVAGTATASGKETPSGNRLSSMNARSSARRTVERIMAAVGRLPEN